MQRNIVAWRATGALKAWQLWLKAEQIRKTGAQYLIAPCHNCYDQISDLSEAYDLGIKVISFKEAIVELMVIPDKFKPLTNNTPS